MERSGVRRNSPGYGPPTSVLAEMYKTDTLMQIAAKVGMPFVTVRWRLKKAKVALRPSSKYGAVEAKEKRARLMKLAAALYKTGLSCDAVGAKFGVSGVCVLNWLNELGVETRPRHFRRKS